MDRLGVGFLKVAVLSTMLQAGSIRSSGRMKIETREHPVLQLNQTLSHIPLVLKQHTVSGEVRIQHEASFPK